uniref:Uncharacterized protein n=1 Tax=Acrobeloides nanus TaxID=290746 RepID=A0A914C5M3_9BILA
MQNSDQYQPIPIEDVEQTTKNGYTGCRICDIRKGAKIVVILGLILDFIFVIIVLANAILRIFGKDWDGGTMRGVVGLAICVIVVHSLILYGLKTEKPCPSIPYLIIKKVSFKTYSYYKRNQSINLS